MGHEAYWDDLNKERIELFPFNLDHHREHLANYRREDNSELFARLDELIIRYNR
jgi:hypothetical protein